MPGNAPATRGTKALSKKYLADAREAAKEINAVADKERDSRFENGLKVFQILGGFIKAHKDDSMTACMEVCRQMPENSGHEWDHGTLHRYYIAYNSARDSGRLEKMQSGTLPKLSPARMRECELAAAASIEKKDKEGNVVKDKEGKPVLEPILNKRQVDKIYKEAASTPLRTWRDGVKEMIYGPPQIPHKSEQMPPAEGGLTAHWSFMVPPEKDGIYEAAPEQIFANAVMLWKSPKSKIERLNYAIPFCGSGTEVMWLKDCGAKQIWAMDLDVSNIKEPWAEAAQGDCLEPWSVKNDWSDFTFMHPSSFHVTPYGDADKEQRSNLLNINSREDYIGAFRHIAKEARRITKPGGVIALLIRNPMVFTAEDYVEPTIPDILPLFTKNLAYAGMVYCQFGPSSPTQTDAHHHRLRQTMSELHVFKKD